MKRQMRRVGLSALAILAAAGMTRGAASAPGIVWERVEGIYGAGVNRLAVTGDGSMLAGTRGLYRSDDDGATWTPSGLPGGYVGSMAVEGRTVYVGVNLDGRRAIHRSDDAGLSWQATALRVAPNALAVADGVVYAAHPFGRDRLRVSRSTDRGATWSETRIDDGSPVAVTVTPDGVFVASRSTVYRSPDGENGWADIGPSLADDRLVGMVATGGTLYVATRSAAVYRLDPASDAWTRASVDGVEIEWLRAAGGALYAGTEGLRPSNEPGVVVSRDGGRTWNEVTIGEGLRGSDVLAVGSRVYIGSEAGVFLSEDDGASWRDVSRGLSDPRVQGVAAVGERVYIGGSAGVHASDDGGRTWRRTDFYRETPVLAADGRTVYAATWSHGLFRSDDAGHTWREINDGVPTQDNGDHIYFPSNAREILPTDDGIYVDYYHGAFLRSADGEAWEPVTGPMYGDTPIFPVGDGPLSIGEHDGALYVNAHCYTARTFDGDTWEELRGAGCVRGADLHTFDGQLYIAAERGVYRWREETREWLDASEGLPLQRENSPDDDREFYGTRFASLGRSLYVGSQTHPGAYRLYAGTDEWVSAGLEDLRVLGLLAYDGGLLAGTDAGLFRATVDQNVAVEPRGKNATAWADLKLAALTPEQSALLPNYPNPFNPETWIPFDLAEPATVAVTIYDARGRVVRKLDLGRLSPGRYRERDRAAYWDGRDLTGSPVASGVYVYEIAAGPYSARRKTVVLK